MLYVDDEDDEEPWNRAAAKEPYGSLEFSEIDRLCSRGRRLCSEKAIVFERYDLRNKVGALRIY